MKDNNIEKELKSVTAAIKGSKKYRHTPIETIQKIALAEFGHHKNKKNYEKAIRKRLHNIVAPFLGDPDYDSAISDLRAAFKNGNESIIFKTCENIMNMHHSTRERLPVLKQFYTEIFNYTGKPQAILDIACGLNPLSFLWMDLPTDIQYHAYDIHEKRIEFINQYFILQGLQPLAKIQDIAVKMPEESADIALFLKELPRFEKNYDKLSLMVLESLRVKYLIVSFPTVSIRGNRSLTIHYRNFFHKLISAKKWKVTEIEFESESVFCVEK